MRSLGVEKCHESGRIKKASGKETNWRRCTYVHINLAPFVSSAELSVPKIPF
jgi:hypothetical protein